jgi:ribonuclease R
MVKENELEKLKEQLVGKKSMTLSEISNFLGWSTKYKKLNREVLEEWMAAGELLRNKRGKYNIPENMGFLKGTFTVIKDKFAFVDTKTEGIFIPRSKFNSALDGDIVLIRVTKETDDGKKKEGEVEQIIKRSRDKIIGIFEKSQNFGFVKPTHSFGRDIFIPRKGMRNAKNGELVLVRMTFWGGEGKKPEGEIEEILGDPYNTTTMIDALIKREGISEEFAPEILREVQSIEDEISEEELKKRRDLRDLPIITIDGEDAKDLDDAVYVEKLKNGNYRLIVSIADVSHYIKDGSILDKEAQKRGNSVYLVDRVLPMFPREISNGMCSLNPRENKLTFTCEMEIDPSGKIVDTDTYKSVIKTAHRMTYSGVNKILDGDEKFTKEYEDIKEMLFTMFDLSKILREVKYQRGSIDFDIPEIKVVLDENGKVEQLKKRERGEAERIIEDFMISANEAVAEKLFWLEIPSVYRTHDKPDPEKIKSLNDTLAKFNYRIHSSEDLHPKRFQAIIEDSKDKDISMIVHKFILMSLKQARYTVDNTGHFGLASNYYTHFTSPIRRYSDLMVHRILGTTMSGYPNKKQVAKWSKNLDGVCQHISKTERDAMKIEDESVKIKVVEYMMDRVGEVYDARIIGFSNKRVFFETEEYVDCFWDVVSADDYYEFDDVEYVMKSRDKGEVLNLGDKMKVLIARADLKELEVEVVPYTSKMDDTFKKYR